MFTRTRFIPTVYRSFHLHNQTIICRPRCSVRLKSTLKSTNGNEFVFERDTRDKSSKFETFASGIQSGKREALAKSITLIESSLERHREEADALLERIARNQLQAKPNAAMDPAMVAAFEAIVNDPTEPEGRRRQAAVRLSTHRGMERKERRFPYTMRLGIAGPPGNIAIRYCYFLFQILPLFTFKST